jgi:hypothetical protein
VLPWGLAAAPGQPAGQQQLQPAAQEQGTLSSAKHIAMLLFLNEVWIKSCVIGKLPQLNQPKDKVHNMLRLDLFNMVTFQCSAVTQHPWQQQIVCWLVLQVRSLACVRATTVATAGACNKQCLSWHVHMLQLQHAHSTMHVQLLASRAGQPHPQLPGRALPADLPAAPMQPSGTAWWRHWLYV